ncbi:tyrosine--tRNA ligase [[Eubacterium] cellulosolvens]
MGTGLVCGTKIKDMVEAGFEFTIFLADWHSWINNKLEGDMDNIKMAGEYFKEGFTSVGVPPNKVRYVWASEIVKDSTYWEKVIKIALTSSVSRMKRSLTIAGRSMGSDEMKTALLFYPCMQATDIFQMNLDIACSGIDQRKVHMLAREVADDLKMKKPVCIHTPLLLGLEPPGETNDAYDEIKNYSLRIGAKMSKSRNENCIYIHDPPEDIKKKIGRAYCPPKDADANPIIDIIEYVIFPIKKEFKLQRADKFGGDMDYTAVSELKRAYSKGLIHPLDLKKSTVENLNPILEGTRRYFINSSKARELLEKVKKLEVTR